MRWRSIGGSCVRRSRATAVGVDTQGDAFFIAFPTAPGALAAAAEMLEALAAGPIRLRMGVHTGTPHLADEGYVGVDVHRAARIAASGHGGTGALSSSAAALLGWSGCVDLGEHRLKDLSAPERIYQLGDRDFAPLKTLYRTNLPVPATPFLGREQELADVLGLLEGARLLTLTGRAARARRGSASRRRRRRPNGIPTGSSGRRWRRYAQPTARGWDSRTISPSQRVGVCATSGTGRRVSLRLAGRRECPSLRSSTYDSDESTEGDSERPTRSSRSPKIAGRSVPMSPRRGVVERRRRVSSTS
jgi:hypothetical protein